MNISNLGRLIGAGLLALGLHALTPGVAASVGDRDAPSSRTAGGALSGAQATLSPADGRRSTESPE